MLFACSKDTLCDACKGVEDLEESNQRKDRGDQRDDGGVVVKDTTPGVAEDDKDYATVRIWLSVGTKIEDTVRNGPVETSNAKSKE